jgi:hypothetical protein
MRVKVGVVTGVADPRDMKRSSAGRATNHPEIHGTSRLAKHESRTSFFSASLSLTNELLNIVIK